MGLTGIDFHDWTKGGDVVTAVGRTCFKCGKECYDPSWMWWSGEEGGDEEGMIFLHLSCALKLQMDLNNDLHEYHKRTGTEPKST